MKSTIRQRAGRLGGLTTLERHGKEHFSKVGKTGGRPRNLTISELRSLSYGSQGGEVKSASKEHAKTR